MYCIFFESSIVTSLKERLYEADAMSNELCGCMGTVGRCFVIYRDRALVKCIGVALETFDQASLVNSLERLLDLVADPDVSACCVSTARRLFSLDEGGVQYGNVYHQLAAVE